MKRLHIFALAATVAASASAQSAIDAYSISQNELRGTARFMSMAGAFGALGGDMSTLNQNPAGIGVYRSSEIGFTLDLNFQSTTTDENGLTTPHDKYSQTKFNCNNFGYVGAVQLNNSTMPYFQWGASYSRVVSFDRVYQGTFSDLTGSLTNYVADYSGDYTTSELNAWDDKYNPYLDSSAPWMSILLYNNYLINPKGKGYVGLYTDGSTGYGNYEMRERGYVDEYSLNFGGNFSDKVYWGIGFGITDLDFRQESYYSETFNNAVIPDGEATGTMIGKGGYGLNSFKRIYGTGFNFKAGVIVKPINELRLGLAVHTPTYYNLSQDGTASVDYELSSGYPIEKTPEDIFWTDYGYNDFFQWKNRTPWRLMASAAGVVGGRFILSADYEYRPYQDMKIHDMRGVPYRYMNEDVKTYYRNTNIARVGAEFRVTPQFSVRAGYSYESTPVTERASGEYTAIYTSGPDDTECTPSFTLDNSTQYVTAGIGYRYNGFGIDLAYVYKHRKSAYYGFTPVDYGGNYTNAPHGNVTDNNNSIVMTLSYKF